MGANCNERQNSFLESFQIPLRRRFAVDAEGGRVVLPSKAPQTAMYCRLVLAEKAWEGIQVETSDRKGPLH